MEDITSNYEFLLRRVYTFYNDTEEYYPKGYDLQKPCSTIYDLHSHLTWAFKNHVDLMLHVIECD